MPAGSARPHLLRNRERNVGIEHRGRSSRCRNPRPRGSGPRGTPDELLQLVAASSDPIAIFMAFLRTTSARATSCLPRFRASQAPSRASGGGLQEQRTRVAPASRTPRDRSPRRLAGPPSRRGRGSIPCPPQRQPPYGRGTRRRAGRRRGRVESGAGGASASTSVLSPTLGLADLLDRVQARFQHGRKMGASDTPDRPTPGHGAEEGAIERPIEPPTH